MKRLPALPVPVGLALTALLAAAVCAAPPDAPLRLNAPSGGGGVVGGNCRYDNYAGTATIVSVQSTVESKAQVKTAGYEGLEVRFTVNTKEVIRQYWAAPKVRQPQVFKMTNDWYPGPKFIEKYKIAKGKTYPCIVMVQTSGTCTPLLFDLPGVDPGDYQDGAPKAAEPKAAGGKDDKKDEKKDDSGF